MRGVSAWRQHQPTVQRGARVSVASFQPSGTDEPYWGTGKNIWWRFWREDGEPWALAGLWSEWTDPETGESAMASVDSQY